MGKLTKTLSLYHRDDKGELIPQSVKLQLSEKDATDYPDLVDTEIAITPLSRGEIKTIFGDTESEDADDKIIIEHCKEPAYTAEELKIAKPVIVRSIVKTILAESGIKILATGEKKIDKETDDFGKN